MVSKKVKSRITVFHCGFIYSGGGERLVLTQVRGLRDRGYQVDIFAPNIDPENCFPDLITQAEVKTLLPQLPKWLPFRDGALMILTSLLAPFFFWRFRKTDLFFGANQPGAWLAYCLAKILKKPYLVYINQPNRLIYPRKIDQRTGWQTRSDYYLLAIIINYLKPLVAWLDRVSFTQADSILVDGGYIRKSVEKIYKRKGINAPAGASWQPLKNLSLNPASAYQGRLRLKGQTIKKPYILITNRHEPQKRFDYVLKAFARVLNQFPEVNLVISGAFTSYTDQIKALAKKLGIAEKVFFLGYLGEKELERVYQKAAVYCYPSPNEDFGLGPLEAGGWGVPTVAWDYAGPTVTIENQKTGFLAKPYQVKDYAAKILKLLKNPRLRARMAKAAWRRTKNQFSWKNHLDVLEKGIKKVLA
jgi:glycosyltransferase involved in cell wall biosynthesis